MQLQRERRRWTRTQSHVSGRISFLNGQKHRSCDCEILNVSSGGALIKVLNATDVPDTFCLVIDKQEDRSIVCQAARRHRDHLGVAFTEPLPVNLVRLFATSGVAPSQPTGFYTWQNRHVEMYDIRRGHDVELRLTPEMVRDGMKFLKDSGQLIGTQPLRDEFVYELLRACLSKQKLDLKSRDSSGQQSVPSSEQATV